MEAARVKLSNLKRLAQEREQAIVEECQNFKPRLCRKSMLIVDRRSIAENFYSDENIKDEDTPIKSSRTEQMYKEAMLKKNFKQ